tara:strand:- start:315 stop:575 length:261 start_codon:yes stop_codon:yes gene_type:complete
MTIKKALETYNSGLFLKLEGSFGRQFVSDFIETGIIKIFNKPGNKVIDGYGREIQLRKAEIDKDRVKELWIDNPEFMIEIEGVNEI